MNKEIYKLVQNTGLEAAALLSVIMTETSGEGFNSDGKLIIQFEPKKFAEFSPKSPRGAWTRNGVDGQTSEWEAFNDAYRENPTAAMEATSIGLPQIMGFNYKRLGFDTVGDMWNYAKEGLKYQVEMLVKFISTDAALERAIKAHDWETFATHYNGAGYKELAKKLGRTPYDKTLAANYIKAKQLLNS